jgi:hypothetical protein
LRNHEPLTVFDIGLTTEIPAELEEGTSAVYGSIQMGDFKEKFIAELSEWSPERYDQQWQEAAKRLVRGEAKSAFITSFLSPSKSFYFTWWPCYRVGETVYVQNQLRFYEQIPSFAVERIYDYVVERKIVSKDDGTAISEWELPLEWIRDFTRGIGS